jgi:hypothetical protein
LGLYELSVVLIDQLSLRKCRSIGLTKWGSFARSIQWLATTEISSFDFEWAKRRIISELCSQGRLTVNEARPMMLLQ